MTKRIPAGVRRLLQLPRSAARRHRELDAEVQFHIAERVAALRQGGMSQVDAELAALRLFGDPAELHAYADRIERKRAPLRAWSEWAAELHQDVLFGLRQLRRAPGFTAAAIVMSALGIGANTAIFSVIHHLILAPLPFADGDRMVTLVMTANGGAFRVEPTQRQVDIWKKNTHTAERITEVNDRRVIIGDTAADIRRQVISVSTIPGTLQFVGARPVLGRDLASDDTLADAPPVALISSALWESDYGESKSVLGKQIRLDDVAYTIVGVLPPHFSLPFVGNKETDIVEPLRHTGGDRPISAIAKLRPGTDVAAANRDLAALFAASASEDASRKQANSHDDLRRGATDIPQLVTAVEQSSENLRHIVVVLFGAVGLVLLIACANVANLLLARAWARQREFAVRIALGAGRARVVRQVLTESALLAVAGGVLGLVVAQGTLRFLLAVQPSNANDLFAAKLQPAVLMWSLGVSLFTGLLFGAAPAIFASSSNVADFLKSSTRSASASRSSQRFRGALVVVEIALSVVLVTGAGLLVRTLVAMQQWDAGITARDLSGMPIVLAGPRYADPARREEIFQQTLSAIRATPGVRDAAWATTMPPENLIGTQTLHIDGVPSAQTDSVALFGVQAATPEFFKVAVIRVVRGRLFAANPARTDRLISDEILVSESFVERFWPGGDPIGARVQQGTGAWSRIVGVVPDVRPPGMEWRDRRMMIYVSMPAAPRDAMLIVRSSLPATTLTSSIRRAAKVADPSLKLRSDLIVAEEKLAHYASFHRFLLGLLGAFAVLALVLAAIGLYGVIAYSVSQRTREIGVRLALGAGRDRVMAMIVRQGLRLSLAGIVIGLALAVAATRGLRSALFGVRPGDPLTLAAVALILGIVAVAAVYTPARRAASIDPVEALRAD